MILETMTKYGAVKGAATASEGISVFKGVPFAAPPVGENRWRAPQPVIPWEGVRDCTEYKPAAIQSKPAVPFYIDEFPIDYTKVEFSEDCLYLNIWTPAKTVDEKLPVMMWIHGGGNEVGFPQEPEHDGEYLAQRGVIYVNVTYRLNIFGFFAHPELTAESEYGASGNYGNLDQLAAIKWLRENIAAFGGDPENITIFGQSAGAGDTHTLCVSPLSKGLFNRAISMSGSGAMSLMRTAELKDCEAKGVEYMKVAGCKNLAELRALPAYMVFGYMKQARMGFTTCVDNYLLSDDYSELIRAGKHHDITYMVGSCSHEGAAFGEGYKNSLEGFKAQAERMFRDFAPKALEGYNVNSDEDAKACTRDLMADGAVYGTNLWAQVHLDKGRTPVYLYLFDRKIPDKDGNPSWESSYHSGDLWYVHGTIDRSWRGMNEDDRKTSDLMMDYWTNFARSGNPNGEGLPQWTPYTDDCRMTMVLNENAAMSEMLDNPGVQILR